MKLLALIGALGLAAVAIAQTTTDAITSSTDTSIALVASSSTTSSLSPEQSCLASCARTDICCQAACVKVPCPNQAQANATNECAASCPQGDGTAGDTAHYASCQSSCISSLFFSTTHVADAATSGNTAATASATVTTGIGGTSASGSGNGASSKASATGSSSSSTGAASNLQLGVTSAGIMGLIVMGFAL